MIYLSHLEMAIIEYLRNYSRVEQCNLLLAFEDKSIDRLLRFISVKYKFKNIVDAIKKIFRYLTFPR